MIQRDVKMTLVDSSTTRATVLAWCCGLGALTSFVPAALVSANVKRPEFRGGSNTGDGLPLVR